MDHERPPYKRTNERMNEIRFVFLSPCTGAGSLVLSRLRAASSCAGVDDGVCVTDTAGVSRGRCFLGLGEGHVASNKHHPRREGITRRTGREGERDGWEGWKFSTFGGPTTSERGPAGLVPRGRGRRAREGGREQEDEVGAARAARKGTGWIRASGNVLSIINDTNHLFPPMANPCVCIANAGDTSRRMCWPRPRPSKHSAAQRSAAQRRE